MLGAIESSYITFGIIPHRMSHEFVFTRSSAYKVGPKSPILAEKEKQFMSPSMSNWI